MRNRDERNLACLVGLPSATLLFGAWGLLVQAHGSRGQLRRADRAVPKDRLRCVITRWEPDLGRRLATARSARLPSQDRRRGTVAAKPPPQDSRRETAATGPPPRNRRNGTAAVGPPPRDRCRGSAECKTTAAGAA